jgi:hypothetical protein
MSRPYRKQQKAVPIDEDIQNIGTSPRMSMPHVPTEADVEQDHCLVKYSASARRAQVRAQTLARAGNESLHREQRRGARFRRGTVRRRRPTPWRPKATLRTARGMQVEQPAFFSSTITLKSSGPTAAEERLRPTNSSISCASAFRAFFIRETSRTTRIGAEHRAFYHSRESPSRLLHRSG